MYAKTSTVGQKAATILFIFHDFCDLGLIP